MNSQPPGSESVEVKVWPADELLITEGPDQGLLLARFLRVTRGQTTFVIVEVSPNGGLTFKRLRAVRHLVDSSGSAITTLKQVGGQDLHLKLPSHRKCRLAKATCYTFRWHPSGRLPANLVRVIVEQWNERRSRVLIEQPREESQDKFWHRVGSPFLLEASSSMADLAKLLSQIPIMELTIPERAISAFRQWLSQQNNPLPGGVDATPV